MTVTNGKLPHTTHIARKRIRECEPWLRLAWAVHFLVTLIVLASGIESNRGTRKYIPISPDVLTSECQKAFVNTLAATADDIDSVVCCTENSENGICSPMPKHLLLAGRLTRFPEAWLLPLFPFVIRWVVIWIHETNGGSRVISKVESALVRLGFYILVMNFRAWIMYFLFNYLEDIIIGSPESGDCWYEHLLSFDQTGCYGKQFDFSDHTVLFFAQMLPIALMEVLHCMVDPVRDALSTTGVALPSRTWLTRLTPLALVVCLAELYAVTLVSVYKTAEYFHTGPEILVGYAMSLLVQLPLFFLQCFPCWHSARNFIFGFPT